MTGLLVLLGGCWNKVLHVTGIGSLSEFMMVIVIKGLGRLVLHYYYGTVGREGPEVWMIFFLEVTTAGGVDHFQGVPERRSYCNAWVQSVQR